MVDVMTKLDVYDKNRWRRHMNSAKITTLPRSPKDVSIIMREDCIAHIMEYAGYGSDMIRDFHSIVQQYRELPDMMSLQTMRRDSCAGKSQRSFLRYLYQGVYEIS